MYGKSTGYIAVGCLKEKPPTYCWRAKKGTSAARAFGVYRATIDAVARRGRQEATYWEQLRTEAKPEFPCNVL